MQDAFGSEVTDSPFASPSATKFKDFLGGKANGGPHRNRATSDATPLSSSPQTLSPYHPALSLPEFITTFGPLVFPLYRAALLRKRILIVGEAPVQMPCNFGLARLIGIQAASSNSCDSLRPLHPREHPLRSTFNPPVRPTATPSPPALQRRNSRHPFPRKALKTRFIIPIRRLRFCLGRIHDRSCACHENPPLRRSRHSPTTILQERFVESVS
jgi:hypothetical protein